MMITARTSVRVRSAQPCDAEDVTRVFCTSWHDAYCGIIPTDDLARQIRCRDVRWWRRQIEDDDSLLVLSASTSVCGYARIGAARGRTPNLGEIQELYLAPVYQGIGLGEHLFEACRATLDDAGFDGLVVKALAANERACDFYVRRGGVQRRIAPQRYGDVRLPRRAYFWD